MHDLAPLIEHTALKADTTPAAIDRLIATARTHGFAGVCLPGGYVRRARTLLDADKDTTTRLVTVAGFPLGNGGSAIKADEAALAIRQGADHVDMVADVGCLIAAREAPSNAEATRLMDHVEADIHRVRQAMQAAARGRPVELKVILETACLDYRGIVDAVKRARDAGADWVKTSTGFGPGGASLAAVAAMQDALRDGPRLKIKAAGGIKTLSQMTAYADMGVDAIGCSGAAEAFAKRAA